MTHDEALEYIHGISWTFCKPGLDRIRELCDKLGNPQDSLKFVQVAGTNGKGSFCSMLSAILTESGLKTGLYTSPYILEFGERMRVNGKNIPNDTLARLTERVRPIADSMTDKPTEFELITAIALLYFKEEACDVVVLECGMGGRLDSTNIVNTSILSVITGISLDHTAFLGDTVEKIAKEKAGIIKKGVPVLYGGESDTVYDVIAGEAANAGSPVYRTDYSEITLHDFSYRGAKFDYKHRSDVNISLAGLYQPRNASLVLEAVDILKSEIPKITEESIKKGLAKAKWPARFETICENPLIIFDGAHNPEGIEAAVESAKSYFTDKVTVLSGVLKDKDYRAISAKISEIASEAYTITPDSPRALPAEEYAAIFKEYGVKATPTVSISEAINLAINSARHSGNPILCLGSLYTYGDVVRAIEESLLKD